MSQRYQPYRDVENSGIEWLGEVPKHWTLKRLKHISPKVGVGLVINPSTYTREEGVYFIFGGDVKEHGFDLRNTRRISPEDSDRLLPSRLNTNDLVSVRVGEPGVTAVVPPELEGANCASILVIRRGPFNSYWLCSAMNSWVGRQQVGLVSYGAAQKQFNVSDAVEFVFPVPPSDEQAEIAAFLDYETSKIDALISKQQQLIALLGEKRQAVISHAVTKGLNPDAPMRDSGIQWLGDVPGHWEIIGLKHLGHIRYGIGEPPKYHDEGVPLIRATNVRSGTITPVGLVYVNPSEIPDKRIVWLLEGDIVVVRSGAGTGDSAIIPAEYGKAIAGFDMVFRCHRANAKFIQFVLLSSYLRYAQIDQMKMRAAQPHLNAEELGGCVSLLPPRREQLEIVEYLTAQTSKMDTIISKASQTIETLKERRTALISAAVTGKIDVRGWKPPSSLGGQETEMEVA